MPKGVYSRPSLEERLWRNTKQAANGCVEWQGPFSPRGYGHISKHIDGRKATLRTHRVAYELSVGPIPDGLIVRHRCDNARDRDTRGRNHETAKEHCPQGHAYDEANTYVSSTGSRKCRACNRARIAAYREARRAQARR